MKFNENNQKNLFAFWEKIELNTQISMIYVKDLTLPAISFNITFQTEFNKNSH